MKKKLYILFFLLFCSVLLYQLETFSLSTSVKYKTQTIPQPLLEAYQVKVDTFFEQSNAPGVQVAILLPDNRIYTFAGGFANIANKEPMNTDHILKIGSVTKVLTAFRINKFYEYNVLTQNDNVQEHLQIFLNQDKNSNILITPEQLITHSSGLQDIFSITALMENLEKPYSQEKVAQIIFDQDLDFYPGLDQEYNNSGFLVADLLAKTALRKGATNSNQKSKLQELSLVNIFESLNMHNIYSALPKRKDVDNLMPQGYSQDENKNNILCGYIDPHFALGSGDLRSDAKSLVFLKNSLPLLLPEYYEPQKMNQKIKAKSAYSNLPKQYQTLPLFPPISITGGAMDYDIYYLAGINIFHWEDDTVLFGKDGTFPGFAAQFHYNPESKIAIAVITNQEKATNEALYLAKELLEVTAKNIDETLIR